MENQGAAVGKDREVEQAVGEGRATAAVDSRKRDPGIDGGGGGTYGVNG